MSELYGTTYTKEQLLGKVGHLHQVGGVELLTAADGPARAVRLLEFRTGTGFNFKVAVDRGMDVGSCEYRGHSLAWLPPTGMPGPWFFGEQDDFGWLRTAMGGLLNTCGLTHIGNPQEVDVSYFNFAARLKQRYGVHDRIAMCPGRLLGYGESWQGDRCKLEAVAEVTQAQVYGENLRLRRTYSAWLGESRFFIHDEVENLGFTPTVHMLLYHLNLGFPLVDAGAQVLAPLSAGQAPVLLAGPAGLDTLTASRVMPAPRSPFELQVFEHTLIPDSEGKVTLLVYNPLLNEGAGLGVYVVYDQSEFPCFLQSNLLGRGTYGLSLEPCTNGFDRQQLAQQGRLIWLEPGEKRQYHLEFGVLQGRQQINEYKERIHALTTLPAQG